MHSLEEIVVMNSNAKRSVKGRFARPQGATSQYKEIERLKVALILILGFVDGSQEPFFGDPLEEIEYIAKRALGEIK